MANSNGNANAVILAPSGGPGATPQAAARKILSELRVQEGGLAAACLH
jgi:hypothetical protein